MLHISVGEVPVVKLEKGGFTRGLVRGEEAPFPTSATIEGEREVEAEPLNEGAFDGSASRGALLPAFLKFRHRVVQEGQGE